jgi:phosphoribosylformimino-5-aminoimidazole carboxamide ribotide isomerase
MPDFTVIPAIDLRNGKCVRLRQGKPADETVYSADPVKTALTWEKEGARMLHVVDLDGAFTGRPVHTDFIARISAALKIPVQAGGGLRTAEQIQHLVDNGVSRVIIGTAACQSDKETGALIEKFGGKLAVGIDARDGLVQTKGWVNTTTIRALDLAGKLDRMGVQTFIYTDTGRDGMLTGPNTNAIIAFCGRVKSAVIASGGVSKPDDITKLKNLALPNLRGIIVGKALYEGKISLKTVY